MPIPDLTPAEIQALAFAGRTDILPRRTRTAMFSSAFAVICVVVALILGNSDRLLGVVFVIYILVVAWERYAYARALATYHSLVRKMAAVIMTPGTPAPPTS